MTLSNLLTTANHGCKGMILLGSDARKFYDAYLSEHVHNSPVYAIAAGIETRKFYDAHLHALLVVIVKLIWAFLVLTYMVLNLAMENFLTPADMPISQYQCIVWGSLFLLATSQLDEPLLLTSGNDPIDV